MNLNWWTYTNLNPSERKGSLTQLMCQLYHYCWFLLHVINISLNNTGRGGSVGGMTDYDAGDLGSIPPMSVFFFFLDYWPATRPTQPYWYPVIHSRGIKAMKKGTGHFTPYANGPAQRWWYSPIPSTPVRSMGHLDIVCHLITLWKHAEVQEMRLVAIILQQQCS